MSADATLIVVTGMPAAGKTTLARELSEELRLPLVTKDDIKDELYETLGAGDIEWSRRLGSAAYALMFVFCRELLAAQRSLIVEANFFAGQHEQDFARLPAHRLVQIHCRAPLDVLAARFTGRADRHAGHLDRERAGELADRLASGVHSPLALDGELIELETSKPVDARGLVERLAATIHRP